MAVDLGRIDMVVATICATAEAGDLVVLSGSVPPGCPYDIYAKLTARLRGQDCVVLLDTSGELLKSALEADVLPNIIKPNRDELADWLSRPRSALIEAARELRQDGVDLEAVSMGAEGALFLSGEDRSAPACRWMGSQARSVRATQR
jgi:1-phosphofructokinase